MRVIVAGSRTVEEKDVRYALDTCPWIGFATAIVSGTARGADRFGEQWAIDNNIPIDRFPADWKAYGKKAGPVRNEEMAKHAEALIAVWDGESRGTASMIDLAEKYGLRVEIVRTDLKRIDEIKPTGVLADWWEFVEERAALNEFSAGLTRRQAEILAVQAFIQNWGPLDELRSRAGSPQS
ncbi:SLOG family protein [Ralstonia wenshanensis]|nr:SLOG family protein [Ralstonia wenshanensis]